MIEVLHGTLEVLLSVAQGAPVEAGGDQIRLHHDGVIQVDDGLIQTAELPVGLRTVGQRLGIVRGELDGFF
jgi:hypothetical protein